MSPDDMGGFKISHLMCSSVVATVVVTTIKRKT